MLLARGVSKAFRGYSVVTVGGSTHYAGNAEHRHGVKPWELLRKPLKTKDITMPMPRGHGVNELLRRIS